MNIIIQKEGIDKVEIFALLSILRRIFMKKILGKIVCMAFILIFAFGGSMSDAKSILATSGWSTQNGRHVYVGSDGRNLMGWNRISGLWFYFNSSGYMVTGTQNINGKTYQFNNDGSYSREVPATKTSTYTTSTSNGKVKYYDKSGNYLGTGKKYISNASAYTGDTTTASGQRPRWGTIAVDPKVIPLGSKVYVPYYDKVFIANDTGGIIRGTMIDIFMNSATNMRNFGRRNIEIVVLDK